MHLRDIFRIRGVTGAGVYVLLTERCPLSCSHCYTNSSMNSTRELSAEDLRRFVDSFRATPPRLLLLSGGEVFLKPDLVEDLADRAERSGTKTYAMSGMFFARTRHYSNSVYRAISKLHHLAASIDEYHEREVSRGQVFDALDAARRMGVQVSIQSVSRGQDDPYFTDLVVDVRKRFNDEVPIYYLVLKSIGRAAEWSDPRPTPATSASISPCKVATWPVVTFDGTIVACCNPHVVNQRPPAHLNLGHIRENAWPEIASRIRERAQLRAIRLWGPNSLAASAGADHCPGQCETCRLVLPDLDATTPARLQAELGTVRARLLEAAIKHQAAEIDAFSPFEGDGQMLEWGIECQ